MYLQDLQGQFQRLWMWMFFWMRQSKHKAQCQWLFVLKLSPHPRRLTNWKSQRSLLPVSPGWVWQWSYCTDMSVEEWETLIHTPIHSYIHSLPHLFPKVATHHSSFWRGTDAYCIYILHTCHPLREWHIAPGTGGQKKYAHRASIFLTSSGVRWFSSNGHTNSSVPSAWRQLVLWRPQPHYIRK